MVCPTILSDESGAIQTKNNRALLKAGVVNNLIESSLTKRRIDGKNRSQSTFGEARRKSAAMLLGDAYVEETIGEFFGKVR